MKYLIILWLLLATNVTAQNKPLIYFCEKVSGSTEYGVSDRFTPGYLTVVIKSTEQFFMDEVTIQIDKMNRNKNFNYFKTIKYPARKGEYYMYIPNINFSETGIFRVFIMNKDLYLASALIEIF